MLDIKEMVRKGTLVTRESIEDAAARAKEVSRELALSNRQARASRIKEQNEKSARKGGSGRSKVWYETPELRHEAHGKLVVRTTTH